MPCRHQNFPHHFTRQQHSIVFSFLSQRLSPCQVGLDRAQEDKCANKEWQAHPQIDSMAGMYAWSKVSTSSTSLEVPPRCRSRSFTGFDCTIYQLQRSRS